MTGNRPFVRQPGKFNSEADRRNPVAISRSVLQSSFDLPAMNSASAHAAAPETLARSPLLIQLA
jgi:hypothetical protein